MTLYRRLLELSDPDQERVLDRLRSAVYQQRSAWEELESAASTAGFDIQPREIAPIADSLRRASDALELTIESFRPRRRWARHLGLLAMWALFAAMVLIVAALPSNDIPMSDIYVEAQR